MPSFSPRGYFFGKEGTLSETKINHDPWPGDSIICEFGSFSCDGKFKEIVINPANELYGEALWITINQWRGYQRAAEKREEKRKLESSKVV